MGSAYVRQCVVGLGMIMKGIYSENLRHNLDCRSQRHRSMCWAECVYVCVCWPSTESSLKAMTNIKQNRSFGCLCATIVREDRLLSYWAYICVHSFLSFTTLSTQPQLLFLIYAFIMFRLSFLLLANVCDSKTLWFEGQSLIKDQFFNTRCPHSLASSVYYSAALETFGNTWEVTETIVGSTDHLRTVFESIGRESGPERPHRSSGTPEKVAPRTHRTQLLHPSLFAPSVLEPNLWWKRENNKKWLYICK